MTPPKAFLLALLLPLASTQAQAPAAAQQQVLTLVQRFTTAQAAADVPTLRALTADNYIEVSATGDVTPRDKLLASVSGEEGLLGLTVSLGEPSVRLFGPATNPDTAIVIARLTFLLPGPNLTTRPIDMRGTFVARKYPTGWKLLSTQVTGLHPTKSAPAPN